MIGDRSGFSRPLLRTAAIAGATGVLIGAFGAHGLPGWLQPMGLTPEKVADRLDQFDVGARYHLVHAVALLAMLAIPPSRQRTIASVLMGLGIVLFSGSLYLLVLTNTPILGAITPLGGVAWIAGWGMLAFCPQSAMEPA